MVNSGLRLPDGAVDNGRCRLLTARLAARQAHFRHDGCVNRMAPIGPGRPEVVLDQAILGLLLKWAAIPAVGN
jgi:hypothetical protein